MPIQIIRNDITQVTCDAIVNAAKESLLGGGGVDGAIHRAAGPELLEECRTLGGCPMGSAKITKAYGLPAKYVIHTVGPVWRGGRRGEQQLLESCYKSSLELALQYNCESVAFPLVSSGVYGYPKEKAFQVAMDVITTFLMEHELLVYIVLFDKSAVQIGKKLFRDIASYIDDHYVEEHGGGAEAKRRKMLENLPCMVQETSMPYAVAYQEASLPCEKMLCMPLEEWVEQVDESFTQMLLRKIDESGMTDAQCYKKANVNRKLFSKIRGDIHYRPSKSTALAFAVALELSLEETKDLLMKAGFALSRSSKFDIIVEYFISANNYNIYEINEALFAFDQSLLGT